MNGDTSSTGGRQPSAALDDLMTLVDAFVPPRAADDRASAEAVADAERVSRTWSSDEPGALRPGSDAHRRAFCAMFRETFNPYRPSVIAWPKLSPEELHRLTALPIWDIAVKTEGQARLRFAAYAKSVDDAEMRSVIMLNAWEEDRHKQVLSRLVETYGIAVDPEPAYDVPRDVEWGYLLTGFSECIDSFFAFGLFDMARRSGFFPAELVETFEPVIQEECRHILLFANWLAWYRARLTAWQRLRFELRVVGVWIHIAYLRVGLARTIDKKETPRNDNFTVHGARAVSPVTIGFRDLLSVCLSENGRRFAGYDSRLARPAAIPFLARMVLGITGLWGRRKAVPRG